MDGLLGHLGVGADKSAGMSARKMRQGPNAQGRRAKGPKLPGLNSLHTQEISLSNPIN